MPDSAWNGSAIDDGGPRHRLPRRGGPPGRPEGTGPCVRAGESRDVCTPNDEEAMVKVTGVALERGAGAQNAPSWRGGGPLAERRKCREVSARLSRRDLLRVGAVAAVGAAWAGSAWRTPPVALGQEAPKRGGTLRIGSRGGGAAETLSPM